MLAKVSQPLRLSYNKSWSVTSSYILQIKKINLKPALLTEVSPFG